MKPLNTFERENSQTNDHNHPTLRDAQSSVARIATTLKAGCAP